MNPLYKSSIFNTSGDYIIIVIFIFLPLYGFLYVTLSGQMIEGIYYFIYLMILPLLIRPLYMLRYIKVYEDYILIKFFNEEKVLDYSEIQSVRQVLGFGDVGRRWLSIKYKDKQTNKIKTILVDPEIYTKKEDRSSRSGFGYWRNELNITKFIRGKAIKHSSNYLN